MKKVRYIAINFGFAICIYYGIYGDNEGAKNLALVYSWFVFTVSLLMFSDTVVKAIKDSKPTPSINRSIDVLFDISVVIAFVYAGWIITGIFYLIHMLLIHSRYDEIYNIDNEVLQS